MISSSTFYLIAGIMIGSYAEQFNTSNLSAFLYIVLTTVTARYLAYFLEYYKVLKKD